MISDKLCKMENFDWKSEILETENLDIMNLPVICHQATSEHLPRNVNTFTIFSTFYNKGTFISCLIKDFEENVGKNTFKEYFDPSGIFKPATLFYFI